MSLTERISTELKEAMKAGDKTRISTLRLLSAQIQNEEISQRTNSLSEDELLKIVQREVKKRKEAAESFRQAGRNGDAEKEDAEKQVLLAYLPEQMSDEEIGKIIDDIVGSGTPVNLGQVIGRVMALVKGKADGLRVKQLVEKKLKA